MVSNTERIQANNAELQECIDIANNLPNGGGGEPYEGDYEIIPKVEPQTMLTKNKVMTDDVTIKAIPIAEVTNETGGKTATIG